MSVGGCGLGSVVVEVGAGDGSNGGAGVGWAASSAIFGGVKVK